MGTSPIKDRGAQLARQVPGWGAARLPTRVAEVGPGGRVGVGGHPGAQGMAYAELAGLPPVTGLYTTIACLVGYALMGPSRILVLGPDSSVSPLILAAILPLVAADDPATAITLAGMMAVLVGLIMIGLGTAKLGFVADLLSMEVQVGYMNGLGTHHHRRPAAQAVRLLDRRRGLHFADPGLLVQLRPEGRHHPRGWPRDAGRPARPSPGDEQAPRDPARDRRRDSGLRGARLV